MTDSGASERNGWRLDQEGSTTAVTDHGGRRLVRSRCAVFAGLLVAVFLPMRGLAQGAPGQGPAFLVKDINTVAEASNPSGLTDVNGTLFFVADDGSNDGNLWKSDGTAAGTVRLHPQVRAHRLTNVNGTLFFSDTARAELGGALWKSDGTEAGTTKVKDLNPTPPSYPSGTGPDFGPFELTDVNGTLFFTGFDQVCRKLGLWKSDGTEFGTVFVKRLDATAAATLHAPRLVVGVSQPRGEEGGAPTSGGPAGGPDINPCCFLLCGAVSELTNVGGTLFFVAHDETGQPGLWKSDGTTDGTLRIKDLPLRVEDLPADLTNVDGTLFFTGDDGNGSALLWRSDGTEAGTTPLATFTTRPRELTNVNGTLFFFATDQPPSDPDGIQFYLDLWKSDGTAAGTVRVKDLPFLSPAHLTDVNGTLFFQAIGPGVGLWKSDGTEAGTAVVKDFSSGLDHLTAANGTLFFVADDGTSGPNLWKSDGTESGTVRVQDINPSPYGAGPSHLTSVNGTLFFTGDDGRTGAELWKSDGTEAGTTLVKDINRNTLSAAPSELTDVNGWLFFLVNRAELWRTDGSVAGTLPVKAFSGSLAQRGLTNVNGELLFIAYQEDSGQELWKSDGTMAGTVLVKDINPGVVDAFEFPRDDLVNVEGTLFFPADDGTHGFELWRSDGTEAGTRLVKDIYAGPNASNPINLTNVNGTLFFGAYAGGSGFELWKSDGTAAGTGMVRSGYPSDSQQMISVDGTLFFAGYDGAGSLGLWRSDGTEEGTVPVWNSGSPYNSPFALTRVNNAVYFLAGAPVPDFPDLIGLWNSDGTTAGTVGLRRFKLTPPLKKGFPRAYPSGLTNVNGTLFFFAAGRPAAATVQLWKSNGTFASTVPVTDIDGFNPGNVTNLNGTLLFFAQATDGGPALWKSNRTARTTLRIQDLAPSADDAPTSPFTISGSNVYFAATDRQHGTELWALPLSAVLPPCLGDCDANGTVTVAELLRGVNIALGRSPLSACPAFDRDGSGTVTIAELVAGVGSVLNACVTITSAPRGT